MTEILTESFCERCGTRYTFESAAPRKSRLGRVRVVSKGLRNYVLQDESSLSEAMADARSDEERAATAHQLDAFHKTFNFCMSCRQYTCGNCWNTPDGRCLTCSPIAGLELPEVEAAIAVEPEPETVDAADLAPGAWPEADLAPDRLARAMGLAAISETAAEPVDAVAAPVDAPASVSEGGPDAVAAGPADIDAAAELAAELAAEPEAEPADAVVEPAPAAAAAQVIGLAPGQSLEDALAAYEAQAAAEELASAGAAVEPEPVAVEPEPEPEAVEVELEPVAVEPEHEAVAVELEPVAVELEPVAVEPEPVAAEPEPVAAEPEPEIATQAKDDIVAQPAWPATPQTLLDGAPAPLPEPGPAASPWLTVAPDDGAAPQWPANPQWGRTSPGREVPSTLAGRPLIPRDDAASLWAASAREVLSGGPASSGPAAGAAPVSATPQPCVSCGLSLSANARFCRRCGTRQG